MNELTEKKVNDEEETDKKLEELGYKEDFGLYINNKLLSNTQVIDILFHPKQFKLKKDYDNNLYQLNSKIKEKLFLFDLYHQEFQKCLQYGFSENDWIITEEIKEEESNLIMELEKYETSLLSFFEKEFEIENKDAFEIINSINSTIKSEVQNAKEWIKDLTKIKLDQANAERMVYSKINRIHIIIEFIERLSNQFSNYQSKIYKQYENSAIKIMERAKLIKNLIEMKTFVQKEDLIQKWIDTEPNFEKQYLNEETIINNIKDLIDYVKLDINYSYDEKFVFWAIQNKYSKYLRFN